jgi:2-polyprenyl-6-methoxyphenol hydroxylase-like FAD-dependent oxidoreductase
VKDVRFVDGRGRTTSGLSTDVFRRLTGDRFTSLRRSDLSAALFSALPQGVEVIFGDSIRAVDQGEEGVDVAFDHAPPRRVDLVIGADGLHSRVRELVFGTQEQFEVRLGYHVAAFDAIGYRPRDDLVYLSHTRPGRQVSRFSMRDDRTLFLFIFRNDQLPGPSPRSEEGIKAALREVFGRDGWEVPQILAAMDRIGDIYFDEVSQIEMDSWSKGRTALVGDAAACVSLLAGEGTGLAMAEAYVLAGELSQAAGDYRVGFAASEARLMPFLKRKQESARKFASTFAPATTLGIVVRDMALRLMRFPAIADYLVGRDLRDDFDLPRYTWN